MNTDPVEILKQGCKILDEVLTKYHFEFEQSGLGKSSGGYSSTALYKEGSRALELHFRYSLGLVTYHFGSLSIEHPAYMRVLLGTNGGNKYPSYSDDPLEAFHCLAYDLEKYANAFLNGDETEFVRCVTAAKQFAALSGFERLVESES